MSTHELPPADWDTFCKRLAESHRNSLIAVNTLEDGQPKQVFADLPLQNIAMHHPKNSCNDVLVIEAGAPGEKPTSLSIVEPIRLILRNPTPEGRFRDLEILAESGENIIRLHPAVAP